MATCCAPNPVVAPAACAEDPSAVAAPDTAALNPKPGQFGPKEEARWLFDLAARTGEGLAATRELIVVPPEIEQRFRTFARTDPAEAIWVENILAYRAAVLEEFDKLVGPIAPALPALPDPAEEELPTMNDLEAAVAFREEIAAASRFHHHALIG